MISKPVVLVFILFLNITNALGADSFCYRSQTGELKCEKSLDDIPHEYRAAAFYKETPDQTKNNQPVLRPTPPIIQNGMPMASSYVGNQSSTPVISEHNLPSRTRTTTEVENNVVNNIDIPPASEITNDNLPSRTRSSIASKSNVPQIEVFVAKWCPHCKLLEAFLKKENISYIRYDVEEDAYGREVFEEENGGIPITKIGASTIIGFEERKFRSLIEAQQPY